MFTGHSNTLNSLVRKGKMGALAGVRYCGGTEGATSTAETQKLSVSVIIAAELLHVSINGDRSK